MPRAGWTTFLDEHALIVMSDHSQTTVEERVNLAGAFSSWRVLTPSDPAPTEAEIALCPAARSAQVYVLDESRRDELVPRAVETLLELEGVDLVVTRDENGVTVRSGRGQLSFRPGGDLVDPRGERWTVEGDHSALLLAVGAGTVTSDEYPDALGRLWSAVDCPHSGDVLVSAVTGHEFVDWGGSDHVGGGSHGSLQRDDSEGVLLMSGMDVPERDQWSLTDVTPLVLDHFRVPLDP